VYVLNLGLNLTVPGVQTQLNVLYNRLGSRIVEVATAFDAGDVIEQPRDVIDFSVMQPIAGGRYELRLTGRDLLGSPQRFSQGEDIVRENLRPRSISLGLSAKL
jgi:hypothetical protein